MTKKIFEIIYLIVNKFIDFRFIESDLKSKNYYKGFKIYSMFIIIIAFIIS